MTLTINGRRVSCRPGTTILEAAEEQGIKIPTLCYHHDLKPFGACRLCLVEDEKTGRLMASCVTPVASNMDIRTDSPRVKKHRTNIVRLMMAEHPESCLVCNKGNRCQLRQIAADLGVGQIDLYPMPNYKSLEQANPFIVRDLSKCILCGKCIRADHELVVVGAIDYNLRGFKSRPATVYDLGLEQSSCTFCGTCVSICPTGALAAKNTRYIGTPQKESLSTCGFCGVGCSLSIGTADGRLVEVNPSHLKDSVNGATLCIRGHFAHDFLNAKERLTQPMIRKNGELESVSWDEALRVVADRLIDIKKKYGPQSVGVLGSSKCTNEENYLIQKIGRVLLGTNNVDNGGFLAGRSALSVIDQRTGGGCRVNQLASLEKAECILVVGANPTHSAPVASYYLKRAARNGTPLIVADPRRIDLVGSSSLWLPLLPQTDLELINGIAAALYKRKGHDAGFIERLTEDFAVYSEGLSALDLERVCRVTGVEMAAIEKATDILKGKKIAFLVGHGIMQQRYGYQSMEALLNLSLMTGSLGSEAGGFYFLSRENNQLGAWDMGAVPESLPGRQSLSNDPARSLWEQVWGVKISPDQGMNVFRMVEEAEKGNLRGLYIMGENLLRSLPQSERVRKALDKLDFLGVQDILENETTQIADAVLPGAAFSEKAGSFTNMEGRIQFFAPVVSPPGNAKADWEILDALATEMGAPRAYGSLDNIRSEIAEYLPMYAELEGHRDVRWIRETAGEGDMIHFSRVVSTVKEEATDDYSFTAILGSQRYHLGSGTRSSLSDRIRDFGVKGEIEISHEDGAKLGVQDGDMVRVQSRCGSVTREVRLEKGLRPGMIFVPTAFDGNNARDLIGLSPPGEADSPGLKTCQVVLEKL